MGEVKPFKLGVVEGFFGKSWSWDARAHYARFLSRNGFTTYLYAPKNDDCFRKHWTRPTPQSHIDDLSRLAGLYNDSGIEFAIGLSPFELYLDFSDTGKDDLARKMEEINAINPDTLCILFDDMHGAVDALARKQLHIMDFVTRTSKARQFIFCPTYYSADPVLDTHFGKRPPDYLDELGSQLDSRIDIFWTGPRVFSDSFPEDHLLEVADTLGRKPLLWDNYPVNDSKNLTELLHLRPFSNRSPALMSLTRGHMANPMNQAWLSQIPLYTLGRMYRDDLENIDDLLEEACSVLCPAALAILLLEDAETFQDRGLAALSKKEKADLCNRYQPHAEHPMAGEILAWLDGEYVFDPACLT